METGLIHRAFAPFKRLTPRWVWSPLRRALNGLLAPILFTFREGHLRSSLLDKAVDAHGQPLPWYTYPAIDFLRERDFSTKSILEFGGGQSTLWWARRSKSVLAFDDHEGWVEYLRKLLPANAKVEFARSSDSVKLDGLFDVIVIDGLDRSALIPIAVQHLSPSGILVCDNSDGYGFQEALSDSGLLRVDFYGMVPAGLGTYSTSIYFSPESWAFDARNSIARHRFTEPVIRQ